MSANKIIIGQIGYGRWGKILNRYFRAHRGFELRKVAVCNPNKKRAGLGKNVELLTSIDPILNDRHIQAVILATPIATHYELAKAVLESGKNLFIEKPITLRGKEAQHLKCLAQENQVKVMVDFTFTFSAAIAEMRQLIEQGEIGEISAIYMAMCNNQPTAQENVYYELGSHMLSLLDLFRPLTSFKFDHFDINRDRQKTREGIIGFFPPHKISFGTIYVSFMHPSRERTIVVMGENKAKITYNALKQPHLLLSKGPKTKRFDQFSEGDNLRFVVEAYYGLIKGHTVFSNLDLAILVTDILEGL
jgi:predicted dehydrogenase